MIAIGAWGFLAPGGSSRQRAGVRRVAYCRIGASPYCRIATRPQSAFRAQPVYKLRRKHAKTSQRQSDNKQSVIDTEEREKPVMG